MNHSLPFPSGLGVALVTPFRPDGNIDFDALGRLVDHVTAGGVDYLVALGTTAETPTLSPEERRAVLGFILKRNGGRLPVVAGIGGNCTAAVVRAVGDFDLTGVSAILSVTPFYNKPGQEGLYRHYMAVAEVSPVPVILYNVPGRTGVNMTPATTLRLARESANIIAIKEACGDVAQFEELLAGRSEGFHILSGDDNMAIPLIERGGEGLISVAANAWPSHMSAMVAAALRHDDATADRLWGNVAAAVRALFDEGNPTGIKAALSIDGIIGNTMRLPLVSASKGLVEKLRRLIEEDGLRPDGQ